MDESRTPVHPRRGVGFCPPVRREAAGRLAHLSILQSNGQSRRLEVGGHR